MWVFESTNCKYFKKINRYNWFWIHTSQSNPTTSSSCYARYVPSSLNVSEPIHHIENGNLDLLLEQMKYTYDKYLVHTGRL